MSIDSKYYTQAEQQYNPSYNQKVTALQNQLAQNQQNLEQQKVGVNANYDYQVQNQNLNNRLNKNNVSNSMLGRGLSNSSIAISGLAEQDAKNTRLVGDINRNRTAELNNIDQQKALLGQNYNNTLAQMEADKYDLAKAYIVYREKRAMVRQSNTTDLSIKELIDGTNDYWNTENSNKNARVVTTQRDYLAGITSTDITRRFLLPEDVVKAHDEGIIHFHDADYFAQKTLNNCCLINLNDMLQNGTVINGVMIEKPHRFITAATIVQ